MPSALMMTWAPNWGTRLRRTLYGVHHPAPWEMLQGHSHHRYYRRRLYHCDQRPMTPRGQQLLIPALPLLRPEPGLPQPQPQRPAPRSAKGGSEVATRRPEQAAEGSRLSLCQAQRLLATRRLRSSRPVH